MAFGINKAKLAVPGYAEQLNKIKESFRIAHENASNLHSQMEKEIESKEAQIAQLQLEINSINTTKAEAEIFMENISKFI